MGPVRRQALSEVDRSLVTEKRLLRGLHMVSLSTRVEPEEHHRNMTASPRDRSATHACVADVAQTAERLTCNQQVAGSTPAVGSRPRRGEVPKRPKGADCKSAGVSLRRFESSPLHRSNSRFAPGASGTASVRQIRERAGCKGIPGLPSVECAPDRRARSEERSRRTLRGTSRSDERGRGEMGCNRRSASGGGSSGGRASAFQAECRGFESRSPLSQAPRSHGLGCAQVAQSAEHVLGKDEVGGSIPLLGLRSHGRTRRILGRDGTEFDAVRHLREDG